MWLCSGNKFKKIKIVTIDCLPVTEQTNGGLKYPPLLILETYLFAKPLLDRIMFLDVLSSYTR